MSLFSARHLPALAAAVVNALSIYQMRRISISGTWYKLLLAGMYCERTLIFMQHNMAFCPYLIIALTCLLLSIPRPTSSREPQKCKDAQYAGSCVLFTMFTASADTKERYPCWASPLFPSNPATESLAATIPTIAMLSRREG